ncbi:MAG: hydroxyacylglutathione hydrolase [Proteobacteria bacterium]|nr:hydroxyacylglutathione hydrolase [Pseudomonadota bacterium]
MLNVKQFRYGSDNLGYLVYGANSGMAIDGGAADAILSFLAERRLSLLYAANTHDHADHTSGNKALLVNSRTRLLRRADLPDGCRMELDGEEIRIIQTPGHTEDSRSFYTGRALIAGDTLFNGTIGNCFSGDLEGFYLSIRKLMALPDETIVYAGHDYVKDSLAFARRLEPENAELAAFLASYDPGHVFSTLAEERRINPYLRFNEPGIVALLESLGLPRETEWVRWRSLMSIE